MKTLVGIISGLLLVVAVAGFAPSHSDASGFLGVNQSANELVGCVPDEIATALLDTGQFAAGGGNVLILCSEGYTPVHKVLPLP